MKPAVIAIGICVALLAACATSPRPGEVIMKASATEAHVALPASRVGPGDKVLIYRDVIAPAVGTSPRGERSAGARTSGVEKRLIGEGTVTRLMGDRYVVVEVAPGVEFQEHDYVERK